MSLKSHVYVISYKDSKNGNVVSLLLIFKFWKSLNTKWPVYTSLISSSWYTTRWMIRNTFWSVSCRMVAVLPSCMSDMLLPVLNNINCCFGSSVAIHLHVSHNRIHSHHRYLEHIFLLYWAGDGACGFIICPLLYYPPVLFDLCEPSESLCLKVRQSLPTYMWRNWLDSWRIVQGVV